MKALIPISIYENGTGLTIYLDDRRVWGGKLGPRPKSILEGNLKLKDLSDALSDYLQPKPDVTVLVETLEEMIDVAKRVDSLESFPSDPIERAEEAIRAYRKQGGDL